MGAPETSTKLREILATLERIARDKRRPRPRRAGSGWIACCPSHDDHKPSLSVSLGDRGIVLNCLATRCTYDAICAALDVRPEELFYDYDPTRSGERSVDEPRRREPPRASSTGAPGVTLAQFAAAKGLHVDALQFLGVGDCLYRGKPAVEFTYRRRDGSRARTKLRLTLDDSDKSLDRFAWGPGSSADIVAYELDGGALAREQRRLVIVEGESDTVTLHVAGIAALGIPGAKMTTRLEAHHLDGIDHVFVVREAGEAGTSFVRDLSTRMSGALSFKGGVHELALKLEGRDELVDPSELYLADREAFRSRMLLALDRAQEPPPRSKSFLDLIGTMASDGLILPLGIPQLDRSFRRGGLPTGKLLVVLGGPGSHKTGLIVQLIDKLSRDGVAVLGMAFDEPRPNLLVRLGQLAGFGRDALEDAGDAGQAVRAKLARDEVALNRQLRWVELDEPDEAQTLEEAHAELVRMPGRARALVIDSLQHVRCAAAEALKDADPRLRMDAKVGVIKSFRKSGTIVILVSETNRGFYNTRDKRLEYSDVLAAAKESSGIEFGIDVLIGLAPDKDDEDLIELLVAKNRPGRQARFQVRWDRDRARVDELDAREVAAAAESRETEVDAKERVSVDEVKLRILKALASNPYGLSKNAVRIAANGDKRGKAGKFERAFVELGLEGKIRPLKANIWVLAGYQNGAGEQ